MRFFLGGIYAYAGFLKLMEPHENFRGVLSHYEIIPPFLLDPLSRGLPWVEWIVGVFVILGYAPRLSSLVLGILSASLVAVLVSSPSFWGTAGGSCGCFGQYGPQLTTRQMAIVDLTNALIGFKFFFTSGHPFSLHNWLVRKDESSQA